MKLNSVNPCYRRGHNVLRQQPDHTYTGVFPQTSPLGARNDGRLVPELLKVVILESRIIWRTQPRGTSERIELSMLSLPEHGHPYIFALSGAPADVLPFRSAVIKQYVLNFGNLEKNWAPRVRARVCQQPPLGLKQ